MTSSGKASRLARRWWASDALTAEPTDRVEAMDDFGDFYAARKDAVLRAVVAATGDRSGAEDAVAEAFTRAYARWEQVGGHPSPTAWVLRTALNAYRSWWRRLRRERASDSVAPASPAAEPPGSEGLDPDLRRLVASLPTRQRQVVALRVLADLSAQEVGAVLGIRTATVHVHLHRGLETLRQRVRPRQPVGTEDGPEAEEEWR